MKFKQVFYGRGSRDYDVLGSSAGSAVTAEVARICEGIQTPRTDRQGDASPFLFQRKFGDSLLMGCGRDGALDPYGRKTLFYHVLVADAKEMMRRGLSAADLYRAGVFAEAFTAGDVGDLEVDDARLAPAAAAKNCAIKFPAVVSCTRADGEKILSLIGSRLASCDWATISWGILQGFDVVGIDNSCNLARVPDGIRIYTIGGDELNVERVSQRAADALDTGAHSESSPSCDADAHERVPPAGRNELRPSRRAPLFCLIAGAILGGVAGYWLGSSAHAPREGGGRSELAPPQVVHEIPQDVRDAISTLMSTVNTEPMFKNKFSQTPELKKAKEILEKSLRQGDYRATGSW